MGGRWTGDKHKNDEYVGTERESCVGVVWSVVFTNGKKIDTQSSVQ